MGGGKSLISKLIVLFICLLCFTFANAQYKVGDIYDKDGVKGLVVKVDENGEHGLIMSLDKCTSKWYADKKAKFQTEAFYEDDGEKNMAAIERYITENNLSWEIFPFFGWCREKGKGWYAPALDEMKAIIVAVNGSYGKFSASHMDAVDSVIKQNGGDSLFGHTKLPIGNHNMALTMWTSTEAKKGKVYGGAFFPTNPFGNPDAKEFEIPKTHGKYLGSRAVRKF